MKKQASPVPTPRAAALSQSANRFSAGAASTWQKIAGSSARLAAASRHGAGAARLATPLAPPSTPRASRITLESQKAGHVEAPVAKPETIRQVGWREVEQTVSVSTKRKYSLFGIGFGPRVPVFEIEKVKLPIYQETDREKQYYAPVKVEDILRVKREGLQPQLASREKSTAAKTTEQFAHRKYLDFFTTEADAQSHGRTTIGDAYAIVKFNIPEYQNFHPTTSTAYQSDKTGKLAAAQMRQGIPASCIKSIKTHK